MIVLMAAGLITGACGGSGNSAASNEQQEASEELVWFEDDFDAASEEALASGKPLLLDMYADYCPPCRTLGEEYFTSDEMYPILSKFVLVRLDIENPVVEPLAIQYNVSSIPCIVIAEADGTEIDRIVGATPTIAEYIRALEEIYEQI